MFSFNNRINGDDWKAKSLLDGNYLIMKYRLRQL